MKSQICVKDAIRKCANNDYALPYFQRDYVWKKTNVKFFLDSIFRGWPTGSIVLWKKRNIKENLGFRGFLLRGIEKVKIELNLVCIAHNLQKIFNLRAAKSC